MSKLSNPEPDSASNFTDCFNNNLTVNDSGQIEGNFYQAAIKNTGSANGIYDTSNKGESMILEPGASVNLNFNPNGKRYKYPVLYDANGTTFELFATW